MGQFFAITGRDSYATAKLARQALLLFQELAGLRASDCFHSPRAVLVKFPKLKAESSRILRDEEGLCVMGAGTWFYGREIGERALAGLSADTDKLRLTNDTALRLLDGSFALCYRSAGQDGFSIVTDRVGTIHVYVRQIENCTIACTSSLILASLGPTEWNMASCREFLGMGTVFEDRTLFQGIQKLPPASICSYSATGNSSETKYWDLKSWFFDRAPKYGDVPQLADALIASTDIIMAAYPRPAFDLTGGFDSRAVVAAALKAAPVLSTVVNGPAGSPDVVAANRIARELGLDHRHHAIPSNADLWNRFKTAIVLCDGEYSALEYAGTLSHHSTLAGNFDASVNGSNGEVCKGYWWELLFPRTGARLPLDARMIASKRFVYDAWGAGLLEGGSEAALLEAFSGVISRANRQLSGYPNTAQMDNLYLTLRMQRWQGRIASATSRIWPCVSPFMFRQPMEAALSAPPRVRVRNRMTRRLIEHLNPKLAALPLAQGYPATPLRVRNAHRFAPLALEMAFAARRKLWRKSGGVSPAFPASSAVRQLWAEEEVCDLLVARRHAHQDYVFPGTANAIFGKCARSPFHLR